ncbi:MAG: hypothetical protein ACWM05_06065 [Corynebacterium amycolatum]|uniref:hypothetical protein n=1 Tax=Corynebacterium amycolatum TaxID=43765 RepID=UPI00254CD13D|nr:hypothetical protein [Corynebacterium amycolatum]MDK7145577.1 hypothetical protein [Corynebacterium amycolatum]
MEVLHSPDVYLPGKPGAQVLGWFVFGVELGESFPHVEIEFFEAETLGGRDECEPQVVVEFCVVGLAAALVDKHAGVQAEPESAGQSCGVFAGFGVFLGVSGLEIVGGDA